jgi:cytochrome P450
MPATRAALRTHARLVADQLRTRALARRGDPLARLLRPPLPADPYPLYAQIRAEGDLGDERYGVHATASHEVAAAMLRDRRLGVGVAGLGVVEWDALPHHDQLVHPVAHSLLSANPPRHTRLRRIVAPWFTPHATRGMRARVEEIVTEFLDRAAAAGTFDLAADFAVRVPIKVICMLFGIPDSEHDRMRRWGTVLGETADAIRSPRELRQVHGVLTEMTAFFDDLVARRRAGEGAGDDLVSGLLRAGDPLDRTDLVALAGLLLAAGFETTVNLITNGAAVLLEHPEHREALLDGPERAAAFVEEALRFDPPIQMTSRIALEPAEYAGTRLDEGSTVLLLLGGANRDPAVFPDPDRFDPRRPNGREHLAFAAGAHYCLGAGLARLEGEIALRELATRFPGLRAAGAHRVRTGRNIRGRSGMPVRVAP